MCTVEIYEGVKYFFFKLITLIPIVKLLFGKNCSEISSVWFIGEFEYFPVLLLY